MSDILKIIHFDDDIFDLECVSKALAHESIGPKFELFSAISTEELSQHLASIEPDVVLLDIHHHDKGAVGTALMEQLRRSHKDCVIIMRSNIDDGKTIRTYLGFGADDFISKKTNKGDLCLHILNSHQLCLAKRGVQFSAQDQSKLPNDVSAVGGTLTRISSRIPRILASAVSSIFISGDSGTGKEVVASLFRSAIGGSVPFLALNCGAISATLLESELFGHVKGSFTGALAERKGLIESAAGGWLFLDEVTALSHAAQVALLRVLENGELIRVGSNIVKHVDVKFLSATNQDIEAMVADGKFRRDLWQRLNEVSIALPKLANRKEEIPLLVNFFCNTMNGGPYEITASAIEVLCEYDWREGNIRELRNCLRAMTELSRGKKLTPLSIPDRILGKIEEVGTGAVLQKYPRKDRRLNAGESAISFPLDFSKPLVFDDLSNQLLGEVLTGIFKEHGAVSLRKLSGLIGISRSTLSLRIKTLVKNQLMSGTALNQIIKLSDI